MGSYLPPATPSLALNPAHASYLPGLANNFGGVYASAEGSLLPTSQGGLPPWQQAPLPLPQAAGNPAPLAPPGSALSAPSKLNPVRNAGGAKQRRPSVRSTPSTHHVFGTQQASAPTLPPGSASSIRHGGAERAEASAAAAAQAFAAQEMERQRQHLQQMEFRQHQALSRLGAGGPAYDRLQAAGMPMP